MMNEDSDADSDFEKEIKKVFICLQILFINFLIRWDENFGYL